MFPELITLRHNFHIVSSFQIKNILNVKTSLRLKSGRSRHLVEEGVYILLPNMQKRKLVIYRSMRVFSIPAGDSLLCLKSKQEKIQFHVIGLYIKDVLSNTATFYVSQMTQNGNIHKTASKISRKLEDLSTLSNDLFNFLFVLPVHEEFLGSLFLFPNIVF